MKAIFPAVRVYKESFHRLSKNLKRKRPLNKFWTPEEVEELLTLHNNGMTAKTIANDHLDRTQAAITAKINKIYHDQDLIEKLVR